MARDEDDDDALMQGELDLPPKVEHFLMRYQAYASCEDSQIDGIEKELEALEREMTDDERTMARALSRKIPVNKDDDD